MQDIEETFSISTEAVTNSMLPPIVVPIDENPSLASFQEELFLANRSRALDTTKSKDLELGDLFSCPLSHIAASPLQSCEHQPKTASIFVKIESKIDNSKIEFLLPAMSPSLTSHFLKSSYINLAPLTERTQQEAADILNMPCSTLSKKWKEATRSRNWPYRTVKRLDKEIAILNKNYSRTDGKPGVIPSIQPVLDDLIAKRLQETSTVYIQV